MVRWQLLVGMCGERLSCVYALYVVTSRKNTFMFARGLNFFASQLTEILSRHERYKHARIRVVVYKHGFP